MHPTRWHTDGNNTQPRAAPAPRGEAVTQQRVLPWLSVNAADAPAGYRMHTGLHPLGQWGDPCDVRCDACDYRAQAPTMAAAQVLAFRHDEVHR